MTVQPFTVHVADDTLEDLRERLARTRWPGELRTRDGITAPIWPTSRNSRHIGKTSLTGAPKKRP